MRAGQTRTCTFGRERILLLLFLSSVFVLGIIKVEDTDTWTHLSFGRWIWEHKAIPTNEPFILTSKPFPYNNWLFGFLYYLAYLPLKIYGVILLKAFTVTAAFFILLKDSLRPYRNSVVSVLVMTLAVILARHRFVERPDTFLMIFLPFSIFSLNAFVYDNKKYLYALPLVHMAWANSHTTISLMIIPFAAFLVGGLLQRRLGPKHFPFSDAPSASQLKTIVLIFFVSFAASLVSPYFVGQYTHSVGALASSWWRDEIIELQKPTWQTYKTPYIMAGVVCGSFVLTGIRLFRRRRNADVAEKGRKEAELFFIHLLLILPFIIFTLSALRFISLLTVIAAPLVARNLSSLLDSGCRKDLLSRKTVAVLLGLWVVCYPVLMVLHIVEPFEQRRKISGFGINYSLFPEGALRYMDGKGIDGGLFNVFHWGGYITFRDFPKRIPFVDGRGFLSVDLLEKLELARRMPAVMDELEQRYGFHAVLLSYPSLPPDLADIPEGVDFCLPLPDWALVYWDDVSLLYLKKEGKYRDLVEKEAFTFLRPANGIRGFRARLRDETYRANIISELQRNISVSNSFKARSFLGFIYNETGSYREALGIYSQIKDPPSEDYLLEAYNGIALAHSKLGNTDEAVKYYRKSLSLRKDATTLYNLGILLKGKGDGKAALKCFSEALELNPNLTSLYPALAGIYAQLGMAEKAARTMELYQKAGLKKQGEEHFQQGLTAYLNRDFERAIRGFKQSIEANPSNPAPYSNIGYIYFDMGALDKSFDFQKKATDIDPNYANAHYGLALIQKRWGDAKAARAEWEEYLRIEPAGYYARRAKEEIEMLGKPY